MQDKLLLEESRSEMLILMRKKALEMLSNIIDTPAFVDYKNAVLKSALDGIPLEAVLDNPGKSTHAMINLCTKVISGTKGAIMPRTYLPGRVSEDRLTCNDASSIAGTISISREKQTDSANQHY